MRNNRLEHEKLLVNGQVGGERLSKQERDTLRGEVKETQALMDEAKQRPIQE